MFRYPTVYGTDGNGCMQRRDGKYCKYRKQWQLMHDNDNKNMASSGCMRYDKRKCWKISRGNICASTNDRGSRCECNDRMYRHTNVYGTDGNGCMQRRDGKYCKYRKQWQDMHGTRHNYMHLSSSMPEHNLNKCTNNHCNRYASTND